MITVDRSPISMVALIEMVLLLRVTAISTACIDRVVADYVVNLMFDAIAD